MSDYQQCNRCSKPKVSCGCSKPAVRREALYKLNCPLNPTIDPNDYLDTYAMLPNKDTGAPMWYWSGYECNDGKGVPGSYGLGWIPVTGDTLLKSLSMNASCELVATYNDNCVDNNVISTGLEKSINAKIAAAIKPFKDRDILYGAQIAELELCINELKNG